MNRRLQHLRWLMLVGLVSLSIQGFPQTTDTAKEGEVEELRQMVRELSARVAALEGQERQRHPQTLSDGTSASRAATTEDAVTAVSAPPTALAKPPATAPAPPEASQSLPLPALLPGGATLNYYVDGYYDYDFNHPLGRVQYLRAYDVLSNGFSINQTGIVLALDPNVAEGRRYGVRLDLQFGQATDTLQGNPANEPRPDIYRNIFQAYGTYVFPLGKGLTVDVGKCLARLESKGTTRRTR